MNNFICHLICRLQEASGRLWIRRAIPVHTAFLALVFAAIFFTTFSAPSLYAQNQAPQFQPIQAVELHALLRNDELRMWRNSAYRMLDADRTEAALHQMQKIFDSQDDAFELRPDGAGFIGIRESMSQLLSEAPAEIRDHYELIHGGEARAVLRKAQQDHDMQGCREVYRRWFHTRAGFEAAHELAAWHLDHGNPDFAVTIWDRVVSDQLHATRFTDLHRALLIAACRQSGQLKRIDKLTQTASNEDVRLGGDRISLVHWTESLTPPMIEETSDWLQPLGSPEREVLRRGSSPATAAMYTRPLLESMREESTLVQRLKDHHRKNAALGSGMMPVVVANQLIYRNANSVHGLNLEDGRELWHYPLQVSLDAALNPRSDRQDQRDEVELDRFGLCNSLASGISADSERVYIVEGPFDYVPKAPGEGTEHRFSLFRLSALPLDTRNPLTNPQPVVPLWQTGNGSLPALDGMTFLGPPTPAYGKLYCMAEADLLLYLLELEPTTGELLDKTALAILQRPVDRDQSRQHLACIPSISRGIAVCPTLNGLLVAVDLTSKTLRWVHSQHSAIENLQARSPHRRYNHVYEAEGFLTVPMISGDRVFDLPRTSQMLHCVNLSTGAIEWQVDRQDALYIAAVHDDLLIVVDRQGCRALHVGSGNQIWSERIGPPGGRGVMLGDHFLIPLLNGKVVSVDVKTGRQLGYPAPIQSAYGAGHLIASRDLIVSTTPAELSVFRQSHAELHHLLTNQSNHLAPAERQLRIGELQLRTGDLTAARDALSQSLVLAAHSEPIHDSAESLMRELLYIDLRSNPRDAASTLATLNELSKEAEDRINYLAHLAEFQMRQSDWEGARTTVLELTSLPIEVSLTLPGDPQLQVMSRAWGAGLLERLEKTVLPNLPGRQSAALPVPEQYQHESEWPRAIAQFARLPAAEPIREAYARTLMLNDQYQHAESLLLLNRDSSDPTTAVEARRLLVELWDQRGLYEEAAELLHDLGTKYADVPLRNGQTCREYYQEFSKDRLTNLYARRLIPPQEPVNGVRLTLQPPSDHARASVSIGSRFFSYRMRGSQYFIELGRTENFAVSLVDRETGQTLEQVALGEQYFPTRSLEMNPNLVPLWGPNSAAALSVLDRKVMWNDLTWQGTPIKGLLRSGPSGPDFVTYQFDQTLIVADPITGQIRWQRNDLDPKDGIAGDPMNGIIADRECLVVFRSGDGRYRIFDTLDGHEIRAGYLPVSRSYYRVANGRILLYGEEDREQRFTTIRIWDPLTDKNLYEDRVLHQFSQHFPLFDSGKQLAYVSVDQQLKVIETETGVVRLKAPFPGDNATSGINVFEDQDRYYVNIQRSVPLRPMASRSSEARDLMIPWTTVNGDLYVYDRRSGKELWQRNLAACSVIQVPQYRLPFLMCISRIHRHPPGANSMTMSFEAIDGASGRTLGEAQQLPSDSLQQLSYEPELRKLIFRGNQNCWEVEFGKGELPRIMESDGLARIASGSRN